MKLQDRYELRWAGGCFWLLDTRQEGLAYQPPLQLNETAGRMIRALCQGQTPEDVARGIAEAEQCGYAEVLDDVQTLREALHRQGIML